MSLYVIVRLRGTVDIPPDIEKTLYMLRLRRKYTASLYHSSLPGLNGMLKVVESWATWGEIDKSVLVELIRRRGKLIGDKPITDEWVRETLKLNSLDEMAEKLISGEIYYHKLEPYGVKPFFRLHPPRGGFKRSTKKMYGSGGELGYRGHAINDLILRMI
ncbi:MAG: 50S ribosomal protein L30 [Acidilobaceae archaeon]